MATIEELNDTVTLDSESDSSIEVVDETATSGKHLLFFLIYMSYLNCCLLFQLIGGREGTPSCLLASELYLSETIAYQGKRMAQNVDD